MKKNVAAGQKSVFSLCRKWFIKGTKMRVKIAYLVNINVEGIELAFWKVSFQSAVGLRLEG